MNAILRPHPPEWHAERRKGIGGSDATRIMAGDWHQLWLEKTGRAEPEDLSDVLPVQMGSFTEPFNLAWFEKQTGRAVEVPDQRRFWLGRFRHCEVDAFTDFGATVLEAKHVNAFTPAEAQLEKYIWQLEHLMAVTARSRAVLSVLRGNTEWVMFEVESDVQRLSELMDAEDRFWQHVETDTPPDNPDATTVQVAHDDMREADMTGSNEWGAAADEWLACRKQAKRFKGAEKDIKALVEADVKRAHGHGIEVKRSKSGALSIKEMQDVE